MNTKVQNNLFKVKVTMVNQTEKPVSVKSVKKKDRIKGEKYLDEQNRICIWTGKRWHCAHDRQKPNCKDCGGSSICAHGRQRSGCKDCGGSSICAHGRLRSKCKDCGGASICKLAWQEEV